jgi:hypothetical protein
LLPFIAFAILALIYFTRPATLPSRYDGVSHATEKQNAQEAEVDLVQHIDKVVPEPHGLVEGVHDQVHKPLEKVVVAAEAAHTTTKLDDEDKLVVASSGVVQSHVSHSTTAVESKDTAGASLAKPATQLNVSKVALDAHLMSKCPDARDCLRQMVVPAMEEISDLVSFNMSFVQTLKPDDSIECKHGPGECLGDTLILCAQNLYPESTVRSLGFANCMISGYRDIPERAHVQNCALEHGVDFDKLNECATDTDRGERLLREAVKWTRAEGVKYSCTVRVAGETWCVRDGGEWKDCDGGSEVKDLVAKVKKLAAAGKEAGATPTESGASSSATEEDAAPATGKSPAVVDPGAVAKNSTRKDSLNLAHLGEA